MRFSRISLRRLRHKIDRAGLLDRVVDLAMQFCGDASHPAWKDLSCFGSEFTENFWVRRDKLLDRNVLPTAGHLAVRLAEVNAALDGLWLGHNISGVRGEEFCA